VPHRTWLPGQDHDRATYPIRPVARYLPLHSSLDPKGQVSSSPCGKLRISIFFTRWSGQFEKIRLDALFQLDDERLVAKPAVPRTNAGSCPLFKLSRTAHNPGRAWRRSAASQGKPRHRGHPQVTYEVSVQGVAGAARLVRVITYFRAALLAIQRLHSRIDVQYPRVSSAPCTLTRSCGRSQFWLCSALIRDSALRSESSLTILLIQESAGSPVAAQAGDM